MAFILWIVVHLTFQVILNRSVPSDMVARYRIDRLQWRHRFIAFVYLAIPLSWWVMRPAIHWRFVSIGLSFYAAGGALLIAAQRANPYFRAEIVRPPEVIRGGVYRLKHPGYYGLTLMGLGTVLILGTIAGIIPLCAYAAILAVRAWEEGQLIRTGQQASLRIHTSNHRQQI